MAAEQKPATRSPFAYDVFLSHSSLDKPVVRALAERLRADGLRVWFDEWAIQPGDMIGLKVEEGLEQSRVLVLAMSAHAFASEWVTLERHTAMFRDPANAQRRFIPLRLDDAPLKDTLKQFKYVDWRKADDGQYISLRQTCLPDVEALVSVSQIGEPQPQAPNVPASTKAPTRKPRARVLRGHTGTVFSVGLTPDGSRIVSGSNDKTIRVWELSSGRCLATLEGHTGQVFSVALTPDGSRIVSGADDGTIRVWELSSGRCLATLEGHTGLVGSVALTPDGSRIVSGADDDTIRVWELSSGRCLATIEGHTDSVVSVGLTPDGSRIVSGSNDKTIRVWELSSGRCLATLEGHTGQVWSVALTPDGSRIVSGSNDDTIRIWELSSGHCLATIEGHTDSVRSVALTPDGNRIVSGSYDKTIRVWELSSGHCLATLEGMGFVFRVALPLDGSQIVSGSNNNTIRITKMPNYLSSTAETAATKEAEQYTNAKVLLVGDSGVGKSGLAVRLTEDRFDSTISTDGAWATQMKLAHQTSDEMEREIWLWDFAGQPDYRLAHQLFMDETALAVFVFNPQSDDPFEGLGQWDRDLQRASRRPFRKLLVAGRCDRGGLRISSESMERFRQERGFDGYLETSAYTGDGCVELRDEIVRQIPWKEIPWTSSPRIFKLLKEAILKLRDEGHALLRMTELRQQIEMRLPTEAFTPDQLRAVVGLFAGPGLVWQLEFGDFVLLQPERINSYAAAVVRSVRAHTEEIGCIAEDRVLAGDLDYQDMKRLPHEEEAIVLRAMHQTFVEHGLCLREPTGSGNMLVFPSYFKRERPELKGHPAPLVTYHFSGMLDEIYATLVVRLHHTPAFEQAELWRYAVDFRTATGKRIGLKMERRIEGAADLTVYFEPGVSEDTQVTFIRYVHDHLLAKDPEAERTRHYVCPHCHKAVESHDAIRDRLNDGKKDVLCARCEKRVPLWDAIEEKFASAAMREKVRELDVKAGIQIDNESRELILVGHAFAVAGEAGQIFRPTPNSDWGIDGEIEFKNDNGEASGRRVYLQLKSGDSYLNKRKSDERETFTIKNARHAEYWQAHEYPVMLVVRTSDGQIRWMNATEYLKRHGKETKQIPFDGEPFTQLNVWKMRDRVLKEAAA